MNPTEYKAIRAANAEAKKAEFDKVHPALSFVDATVIGEQYTDVCGNTFDARTLASAHVGDWQYVLLKVKDNRHETFPHEDPIRVA